MILIIIAAVLIAIVLLALLWMDPIDLESEGTE